MCDDVTEDVDSFQENVFVDELVVVVKKDLEGKKKIFLNRFFNEKIGVGV